MKKTGLGPLEIQFIAYTQMRKRVLVRTGELIDVLGMSSIQSHGVGS
jgi:hypothetical protein